MKKYIFTFFSVLIVVTIYLTYITENGKCLWFGTLSIGLIIITTCMFYDINEKENNNNHNHNNNKYGGYYGE